MIRCVVLLLLLPLSCCQTHFLSSPQARFYQDGKQKPVVAVVPLFDHTPPTVEWNLGCEMTHAITDRLVKKDKLFLTHEKTVLGLIKNLKENPFSLDIDWMKQAFIDQDFVVFMELLEHAETPLTNSPQEDPATCPAELNMSLRLRVLDLRGETPKIALQEIIHQRQYLPRQFTKYHFYQVAWGKSGFAISPLGLAHAQLTKEIAARIEEYILYQNI